MNLYSAGILLVQYLEWASVDELLTLNQSEDLNGFNIIFVTLKHFKIIINRMALTVSAAQY